MAKRLIALAGMCPILTGIGLTSGCSDTPDTPRLDDAPLACKAPEHAVYRITSVDPSLRHAHVIDLDGDGVPDDALGRAHDMIAGADPSFAVAPRFSARLAPDGDVTWLVAIDRCGSDVRVTVDEGLMLSRSGEPLAPEMLPRAVGTLHDSVIEARDGQAHVPLGALADVAGTIEGGDPARWIIGEGLTVRATAVSHDGVPGGSTGESNGSDGLPDELDGVFAVGFDRTTAQRELASPIASFLTAQPADDWLKAGADGNGDGVVTAQEVEATTPFSDATAGDVVLERLPEPAVSLALRFHATRLP
ncbi:MAG TPA: hypothetical protein VLT45_23015 [Kofleriaceae bacterium]|nr:hypothetical protein [Kofleriaceae bacterium]